MFIGVAAIAVDAGHIQVRRADVQAAADAAALAGIEEYAATRGNTWAADSALSEAQAFAHRFTADAAHLTVARADFKLGNCPATGGCPDASFTSPTSDTNAAQAIVRDTGNLTFARALPGHFSQHASSATSRAIGVPGPEVTKSTCVAPVVMPFQDLLTQLGTGKSPPYTLTAADITKLTSATASNAITFDIPNGSQVSGVSSGEFYQVELPPVYTANGTSQSGQSPSASEFRNAFTCGGGNAAVGVGDWLAILNGQKANQASKGMDNVDGGNYPATIEVALTANFSTTTPGCSGGKIKGCFQVVYLGVLHGYPTARRQERDGLFHGVRPLVRGHHRERWHERRLARFRR